ncbi:MAG: hypothetical protein IJV07_04855 [Alphaproteobacteria bacterium]|nr:hypothetical protein [Alphaproteobacteria bacterium]
MTEAEQSIQQYWNQTGKATIHIGQLSLSRDLATDFEDIQKMVRLSCLSGFYIQMKRIEKPIEPFFMSASSNLPRREETKIIHALLALAASSHGWLTVTASKQLPQDHTVVIPYQEVYQIFQEPRSHC